MQPLFVTIAAQPLFEPNSTFVAALGVTVVFIGLICIVMLCKCIAMIGKITDNGKTATSTPVSAPASAPFAPAAPVTADIPNKQEFVAAVSAALAEEMGTDVSAIRILSIQRL